MPRLLWQKPELHVAGSIPCGYGQCRSHGLGLRRANRATGEGSFVGPCRKVPTWRPCGGLQETVGETPCGAEIHSVGCSRLFKATDDRDYMLLGTALVLH